MTNFTKELRDLINKCNKESGSDTPDLILANYLNDCLKVFNTAIISREFWYGRKVGGENDSKDITKDSESVS